MSPPTSAKSPSEYVAGIEWLDAPVGSFNHLVGNGKHVARDGQPSDSDATICAATSADSGISPKHQKFFCKNVFHTKVTPLWGRTIFGQVFVRGRMSNFQNPKVPPPGGSSASQTTFEGIEGSGLLAFAHCSAPRRLIARSFPPLHHPILLHWTVTRMVAWAAMTRAGAGQIDCSIKAFKLYSTRRTSKVYPHEIDIQETHTKHRKLDS
jgi:hypothetical protein